MSTTLELTLPHFQFRNHHSRWIDASPESVWDSLTSLRPSELTVTKLLVALRYPGRAEMSADTLFRSGPITMLQLHAPAYAVGGSIAQPWKLKPARREIKQLDEFIGFNDPGWVKYLTDFSLTAEKGGTLLRTETRGYCTDEAAWKRFRLYWSAIRIGSGLIRRDMLRSVARKVDDH